MAVQIYTGQSFFFFNDTATTEIYTLSLHDALPISDHVRHHQAAIGHGVVLRPRDRAHVLDEVLGDRKSTRLNSSHGSISYAVFCLKKKKNKNDPFFPKKKKKKNNEK